MCIHRVEFRNIVWYNSNVILKPWLEYIAAKSLVVHFASILSDSNFFRLENEMVFFQEE
jgi:hypothetical protein